MSSALESLWSKLEAAAPQANSLTYLPFSSAGSAKLLAGLRRPANDPPERLLLLHLPRQIARQLRPTDRHQGLRLEPVADQLDRNAAFVSLVLTDLALRDIFSALCTDIIAAVAPVAEPATQLRAMLTRLERWQEMFSLFNPEGLSLMARQGLFGELWTMRWLITEGSTAPTTVLAAWAGPDHHPQDFRFAKAALEVKTTTGNARSLHIASLQQLDAVLTGPLFLLHLPMLLATTDAETLPALVADLMTRFASDGTASAENFSLRLQTAGYFASQATLYQQEAWQVREARLLAVSGDDFPYLRASTLHPAITAATYELEAVALEPWRCPLPTLFTLIS
ncbi:PD-(D/E)XK motif protein (plasmid) [Hymenobacter sp. NBH84]|uniref:PD-(D/E)XK motif protein n=1 Tax=Hymenobacter sp. NBH84 TaxID=2596915 RepID=UPI00162842E1|nr:PD-(D/E)XK motif protein [Hymenobacter sp. NBH84]QNE42032.1 PD-(D/E)XK motif protein [Hymenobacter sp. NBH84]